MSKEEKREVSFSELQRYALERGTYLLQTRVSGKSLNILVAFHKDQELIPILRLPPLYERRRSPLYLAEITVTEFLEVVDRIPMEFSYPAIAGITLDATCLRITTCDGYGQMDIFTTENTRFLLTEYKEAIGYLIAERFLFFYTERLVLEESLLEQLGSRSEG